MPKRHVLIVGAGVTGLTTAYTLERETDWDVTLVESSNRIGGKVQTALLERDQERFVVERGADALFSRKPWALELALELGLEAEITKPQAKEFSMLIGGELHRVPGGLVTLTYSEPEAVNEAEFLSDEAKRQVIGEPDAPAGTGEDESIASFFRRRFGQEFSRKVAEPLLAGTHSGPPESLSMRALYGSYFELERKYGSLAGGMAAKRDSRPVAPSSPNSTGSFVSFRGGMQTLVDSIGSSLQRTEIVLDRSIVQISKARSGEYDLTDSEGSRWSADDVVLAVPSHSGAAVLERSGLATEAAAIMKSIPHHSGAIVSLIYDVAAIGGRIKGTGFLVPYDEACEVTGGTWSSIKWPGRAPADRVLVRLFIGRRDHPGLSLDPEQSEDSEILSGALAAFARIAQPTQPPLWSSVDRWLHALPQYEVGHLDKLAKIYEALRSTPNIYLAGTSYEGVGIPDCVRQGRDVARRLQAEAKIFAHT